MKKISNLNPSRVFTIGAFATSIVAILTGCEVENLEDSSGVSVESMKEDDSNEANEPELDGALQCLVQDEQVSPIAALADEEEKGALDDFIPDPIFADRVVKVAFHIFQDASGENNYKKSDLSKLKSILRGVSNNYKIGAPSDPIAGVDDVDESKVRFSLGRSGKERVYFYQDETLHTSTSQSALASHVRDEGHWRDDVLNVYFTEGMFSSASGFANFPNFDNLDADSYLVMLRRWSSAYNSPWVVTNTLGHELGHNLDLHHTYSGGGDSPLCSGTPWEMDNIFLWDVFGPASSSTCPHTSSWSCDPNQTNQDGCTNNLMGGNGTNNYISPRQVGRLWRALERSSVHRYASIQPGDRVRFRHRDTGKCILTSSVTGNSARNQDCSSNSDRFEYEVQTAGGDYLRFRNLDVNRCLYSEGGNGEKMRGEPCDSDSSRQRFELVPAQHGYRIRHVDTGQCAYGNSSENGTVRHWGCWDDDAMVYDIEVLSEPS